MRALFLLIPLFFVASAAQSAEVKEITSDAGVKAWLVEEHSLPLIAIRVAFKGSGFAYDREGGEGRANMAAAMLTTGAGDMNEREFNQALEEKAIELNTFVNEDMLEVSVQSLSENSEQAFSYLALAIGKPQFESEAVERTRRQILSILKQSEQNPGYLLERGWSKQAFGDHPYSHPLLGTLNSINRLDHYDMEAYAERYLTRENMLVAVVGDITPDQLKKLLDTHFSELPKQYRPDSEVADVAIPAGKQPIVIDYAVPQTLISFGLQGMKRSDPDYYAAYVMNQILAGNGILSTLLNKTLREERGLTYGVFTATFPLAHGASWNGGFSTRNDQAFEALGVLHETLKSFVERGPTDKQMIDAKQYLTGSFMTHLDSNADVAAFLINMQFNQLGTDYLEKRNALIDGVKKDDVIAVTKRMIDPSKLTIVMVGQPTPPTPVKNAVSP